jgi:2-polyprenyl-3-methyl-5-hydroxy-6-metoxy-1,4-benzoquinol methylase
VTNEHVEIEKDTVVNGDGGDGLDLAQLMDRIRSDAEKRKRNSLNFSPPDFSEVTPTNFAPIPNTLPELQLQPRLEQRERYRLSDLLGFHDEAFVRNAYKVILKREPDDAGFAEYLGNLRSGRYSKIDILRSLRFSAEGRKANVSIEGLSWWVNLRRVYRVPLVGYLLQLAVGIFRLPVLIANHRRLESHTAAQLELVANHLNEAVGQLSETEARHYENNRRLVLTNQGQLEALRSALRLQLESVVREHANLVTAQTNFVREQGSFNTAVCARFDQTEAQLRQQTDVQERQHAELLGLKTELEKRIDVTIERLQSFKMSIAQQENRLTRLLERGSTSSVAVQPSELSPAEDDHALDALYVSLEDVLRGTPDEIREQVKVYLPVLNDAGITNDILDVGCGRGELLEVLRDAGLEAKGIDTNLIQVERCQALSLDVVEREALTHLRSLPDESLNAVTALHFAEHLPFENLVSFLDEVGRILRPGGLVILETPNPENLLVGSCNFYLDPTHRNPIPIATMELLLQARGFAELRVMRLHPVADAKIEVKDQLTSHLNHYLYGPMNYAVVARKPGQVEPSPKA